MSAFGKKNQINFIHNHQNQETPTIQLNRLFNPT